MTVALEVCVESLEDALTAARVGAQRVEVCSVLACGGVTPSAGLVELVVERARPACVVLVRPRAGDFVFTTGELAQMRRDVERLRTSGVSGVAVGALTRKGELARSALTELIAAARPLEVVLHRAFDATPDRETALEEAIELGFDRVLTAGGAENALAGARALADLVARARGRIAILPGGGVRAAGVARLVRATGVDQVHSSASAPGRAGRVDPDELEALAAALDVL